MSLKEQNNAKHKNPFKRQYTTYGVLLKGVNDTHESSSPNAKDELSSPNAKDGVSSKDGLPPHPLKRQNATHGRTSSNKGGNKKRKSVRKRNKSNKKRNVRKTVRRR